MLITTFHVRGEVFVVTEDGRIYRVRTNGSNCPAEWVYEYQTQLMC